MNPNGPYGRWWEGPKLCGAPTNTGSPCSSKEILGLEFCLQHVPDDMLEEAEEITGMRRCRNRFGESDACRMIAVAGTGRKGNEPRCANHGANIGSELSQQAARAVAEDRLAMVLAELLDSRQFDLLHPPPIDNPLEELLELAAEVKALKELLRAVVAGKKMQEWRYEATRAGEQIRAEIMLYERSTERLGHLLIQISKLGIEQRLAAIDETVIGNITRALSMALTASGMELSAQAKARKVLMRELKAIDASGSSN